MRDGGSLTISGGTLAAGSVTAGASGGGGATAGQAQGTTLYLNGTGTTTFDVGSGTRTLAGDDAVAGTGVLGKSGAGILALTGANTNFTGGVSVTGGLISFAASNNLGSGTITLNGGGLQWAAGNTTDISSRLAALGAAGGTFDTNGNNVALASSLSGSGSLTKAGTGTLTLSAANSYLGGTIVNAGTLQISISKVPDDDSVPFCSVPPVRVRPPFCVCVVPLRSSCRRARSAQRSPAPAG